MKQKIGGLVNEKRLGFYQLLNSHLVKYILVIV